MSAFGITAKEKFFNKTALAAVPEPEVNMPKRTSFYFSVSIEKKNVDGVDVVTGRVNGDGPTKEFTSVDLLVEELASQISAANEELQG